MITIVLKTLTLLTNSISFCMVLGNTIILRYHYSFYYQKIYSLSKQEYNTKVKALLQSVSKSEKIKTQYGKEGYITNYRRHICYKHSKVTKK